jgi:hypothetical protein
VPIFYPIALSLGIDMQWFAILIAMNLQTNDKRYDAFVNVGGLDGLRGNAFKVEQTKTKRRC